MKKVFRTIVKLLTWSLFFFFPLNKRKIVFSSFYGRGYGDNLKYLAEKIHERSPGALLYWVVLGDAEAKSLPLFIKPIKINSIAYVFHLTTALVWIDNCRKPFVYKKRKQLYIQTWHGGGAQKKCEKDAEDKLGNNYLKMAKHDSHFVDLMISDSRFMTTKYHESFWYDGPVFESGYPRYDPLISNDQSLRAKVRSFFGIDNNKAIVLYAPTFRADYSLSAYDIDYERLLFNLKKRFDKDFVLLVRFHPNIAIKTSNIYFNKKIINATFYPDLQEILVAADVLIGDYSSCNYDFCLKKAPVFRYVSDLNSYYDDRGLYFSFEEYPFPFAENNKDLESIILNFKEKSYLDSLTAFFDRLGSVLLCNASEKVSNVVNDYLNCPNKKSFFEKNKHLFC